MMHIFFSKWSSDLVHIETYCDLDLKGSVSLPKVETLKMIINEESVLYEHGLLSTVSNLKVLLVSGEQAWPEYIMRCLKSNLKLEELTLGQEPSRELFHYDCKDLQFNLKILKNESTAFSNQFAHSQFITFLSMQKDSLKHLKMLRSDVFLLQFALSKLTKLESLSFNDFPKKFWLKGTTI